MKRVASPGLMRDTGCLGLVHWDDPEGMVQGGRREKGSGWETRVHLWWIHVDIWQNQYNIVNFKKKKKKRVLATEQYHHNKVSVQQTGNTWLGQERRQ